ncbi:MAG: TROVE domain-containing protein [Verrucomicrobia bacterium]|nr:TROVE domain-containing protein [Verrucomicrobiota bacterium]
MAINYARLFHRRRTPQSQPIPSSTQAPNSAGGHAWLVDDWTRLDRFLILGAEGGTYYIAEQDLVKQNHDALVRCIQQDGVRAVNRIVEISNSGRAPKNDPAIFALALVAAHGNGEAKAQAFAGLPKVCRIGTHLFHFAEYVKALRGWGRGLRSAVGRWYVEREPDDLALQVVKYQQRDRWSHGDLLRLAHPKAASRDHQAVFRWILSGKHGLGERTVTRWVSGEPWVANYAAVGELPRLIGAFEQIKQASTKQEVVRLILEHDLPREAVSTQWLDEPPVWEALLHRMPLAAMIRNLGKMTSLGLVQPFSDAAKLIASRLSDAQTLKRARIHPLAVLIAGKVYAQGHGEKSRSAGWKPVSEIVDALDAAFYASFTNVEPCGKPMLLALDVSGSMDSSKIAGSRLTAREASAAMALVTAATEPECEIIAFSAPASGGYGGLHGGGEPGIARVSLSPRMRLDDVIQRLRAIPMGGTDCALPMVWARRNKLKVSGFITYTDSETWAGSIHPAQALRLYRDELVSEAKSVVVGMTSNGFTLADPNDRGMLDVVGFDTTVPAMIADFVRS